MKRRTVGPTPPLGALGFRAPPAVPTLPPPEIARRGRLAVPAARRDLFDARGRRAWTRRADGTLDAVLGGRAAYEETAAFLRREIRLGERARETRRRVDARASYWPAFEASVDERLLDSLALSVRPRSGEDDDAYDERLRRLARGMAAREDPVGASLTGPTVLPAPAHARRETGRGPRRAPLPTGDIRKDALALWAVLTPDERGVVGWSPPDTDMSDRRWRRFAERARAAYEGRTTPVGA